jgi:hypothetical protein
LYGIGGRISVDVDAVSVSLLVAENHSGRISSVPNEYKYLFGEATRKRDKLDQSPIVGMIHLDLECPFRASLGEKK